MKRKTLTLCGIWLALVAGLFMVQYIDSEKTHQELLFSTGRALLEQIILTRRWNAMHGGVYVPVTKEIRTNPYLEDPLREIRVNDSLTLTKVNPAYMTRQLAELSAESGTVQVHITSLRPIRTENRATPPEQKALESFEKGVPEVGYITGEGRNMKFFYMAPLKVEKPCLKCHARHGYSEGDIRGGIRIILPVPHKDHLMSLAVGHVVIGLMGLFGIILFMARLGKSYEIIQQQTVIDALTGIPNRRAFMDQMPMEFKRSRRDNSPLSIIMADIDHFKMYNDAYGHVAGDDCLKTVARIIREQIKRPADFCARYGGEEFVMLLPDTSLKDAVFVADRIRTAVEGFRMPNEKAMPLGIVTISLGVATAGGVVLDSYEEALRRADQALYSAKEKGRNRVEVYER